MKLIAAMTPSGLIGASNSIPWHYSEDFKRFRKLTIGCTLIMGHNTVLSLPKKLTNRTVIAISRTSLDNADLRAGDLEQAIVMAENIGKPIWIAGGASIYNEAIDSGVIDYMDITYVPDVDESVLVNPVYFPIDKLKMFDEGTWVTNEVDSRLVNVIYSRK